MRMAIALGVVAAVASFAGVASAEPVQRCPLGRTLSGTCANPSVTIASQQRSIVFSQPRISFLGPALPSSAGYYIDTIRDRQSLSYGIDRPVVTTPIRTPPAGTFIGLPSNINPANLNLAAPYTVVPGGIRTR